MTPEEIRRIIREEISQTSSGKQFTVVPNSLHTHNGIDSQKFSFKNLSDVPPSYNQNSTTSYAGYHVVVNSTATGLTFAPGSSSYMGTVASNAASTPFPTGWSLNHSGTGTYIITHNLGMTNYVVIATSISQASVMYLNGAVGSNSFQLNALSVGGSFQDSDFNFIVNVS